MIVSVACALPLTTKLGPVHIAVTDRDKAPVIWRDVVGLDLISEAHSHVDQIRADKGLSKWDWTPKVDSAFKRDRTKRRLKMRAIAAGNSGD